MCPLSPANNDVLSIFVDLCIKTECYHCSSLGHFARFCNRLESNERRRCQRCHRLGHTAPRCQMPDDQINVVPFWTVHNLGFFRFIPKEDLPVHVAELFESGVRPPFDVRVLWAVNTPSGRRVRTPLNLGPIVGAHVGEIAALDGIFADGTGDQEMDVAGLVEENMADNGDNDVIEIAPIAPEVVVVSDSEDEVEDVGRVASVGAAVSLSVEDMMSAIVRAMFEADGLSVNELVVFGRRLSPNVQEACVEMLAHLKKTAEKYRYFQE